MLSVSNFLGRIVFGFGMDLLRTYASEVFWYNIVAAIMVGCSVLLAFFTEELFLIVGTVLFGMAYGGLNAITAVCINLYFGSTNFGKNSGPVYLGTALAGLVLGLVVGELYDEKADKEHKCYGSQCFQTAFLLQAGMAVLISSLTIYITIRSRQFRKRKDYVKLN